VSLHIFTIFAYDSFCEVGNSGPSYIEIYYIRGKNKLIKTKEKEKENKDINK
jgi:hypothetical protein